MSALTVLEPDERFAPALRAIEAVPGVEVDFLVDAFDQARVQPADRHTVYGILTRATHAELGSPAIALQGATRQERIDDQAPVDLKGVFAWSCVFTRCGSDACNAILVAVDPGHERGCSPANSVTPGQSFARLHKLAVTGLVTT